METNGTTSGATNDNEWQRVATYINFGQTSFHFRIMWYWYEYLKNEKVISLCQRLLQTIVIAVFKINLTNSINLSRSSSVLFLKVTTCYFYKDHRENPKTQTKNKKELKKGKWH